MSTWILVLMTYQGLTAVDGFTSLLSCQNAVDSYKKQAIANVHAVCLEKK